MFTFPDLADAAARGLKQRADDLDAEHAVYGLDRLDELDLHPVLAAGFEHAGYGVAGEQRYPADRARRKLSEGERCDLVLTPDGRPLIVEDAAATLFAPDDAVPLDEAFWLEVKTVSQHTIEGPNARYATELLSTVRRDVTKLAKDDGILHAGLLLILFVESPLVSEHDLGVWADRCLERGLPIGAPCVREFALTDRMGNAACCCALYPVHHL